MGNATSNSLFNLDTNDLIFPNLSTLIKQEDNNTTDMGFGLGGGSTMTSQNLSNATTLLHQLMEANNAEPTVDQMDLNDTTLIEGTIFVLKLVVLKEERVVTFLGLRMYIVVLNIRPVGSPCFQPPVYQLNFSTIPNISDH